jgi:hypothetical protein
MSTLYATIFGEFLLLAFFIIVFLLLRSAVMSFWLFWRTQHFAIATPMVLLELMIPREIMKSPKAMEQVLTAINTTRNAPTNIKAKYWDGEVTRSFSLEIVSFDGNVHFYVRVPQVAKNLVEATFFSYYPDIEVEEVPDYINRLPDNASDAEMKSQVVWGTEIVLAREAAYPIRSYIDFESPDEEKQYDPIGTFLEVFGKLKVGETACFQIIITPKDGKWKDAWKDLLKELKERKDAKPPASGLQVEFPGGGPLPAFIVPEEKKEETPRMTLRTPGEVKVIEAVENNLSKPAFDSLIRFLYVGPKGSSNEGGVFSGLMGALNQYQSLNLNSFRPNPGMVTRTSQWVKPYIFPEQRLWYRRERILFNYRIRETPMGTFAGKLITSFLFNFNTHSQMFELNTESLATLFHPPTRMVLTAPHIERVESRKSGAPAGLAVYGEESDIEKFK